VTATDRASRARRLVHDANNELAAILGYAALARSADLPADLREPTALLDASTRTLAAHVRALAQLARGSEPEHVQDPVTDPAAAPAPDPAPGGPVLVVDDEDAVRRVVVRILEREGLEVIAAADGAEAVARLARDAIGAVLCDHRMPDLSGLQVAACALALQPGLAGRIVIMSGDPGDEALAIAEAEGRIRVLGKPFDARAAIASLAGRARG
jgi:CheY-like chemotaxis protein